MDLVLLSLNACHRMSEGGYRGSLKAPSSHSQKAVYAGLQPNANSFWIP